MSYLVDGEVALWRRMNNPDRRHAIGVARQVVATLGEDAARPVVAAALLHDVGKIESGFRTPARVVATVVWTVVPPERAFAWRASSGVRRRLAEYVLHPELGEELLAAAGADVLTSTWAADHHRSRRDWRLDPVIGDVLKACDDD